MLNSYQSALLLSLCYVDIGANELPDAFSLYVIYIKSFRSASEVIGEVLRSPYRARLSSINLRRRSDCPG